MKKFPAARPTKVKKSYKKKAYVCLCVILVYWKCFQWLFLNDIFWRLQESNWRRSHVVVLRGSDLEATANFQRESARLHDFFWFTYHGHVKFMESILCWFVATLRFKAGRHFCMFKISEKLQVMLSWKTWKSMWVTVFVVNKFSSCYLSFNLLGWKH